MNLFASILSWFVLMTKITSFSCRAVSCQTGRLTKQDHPYSIFFYKPGFYDKKYGTFSENMRQQMLDEARSMFHFAYDSYMLHAFPEDELNPVYCTGRGPDYDNLSNININDVLGDYSLTLIDTLDTLAIMGNTTEFKRAVQLILEHVSFDKDNTVQVFEANIRILGALLSAHLLIVDPEKPFGDLTPPGYKGELLNLAHNLAARLLPAFEGTKTGLPFPRVNLKYGVPKDGATHTCTAGAGSLLLEFGMLSRLLNDPVYEGVAKRALMALWNLRSQRTGLLGNIIDVQTGEWVGKMSGVGAGLDSFYEYLLKSYILFGIEEHYRMFNESYYNVKRYMRKGRPHCNQGLGEHPLYVNVNMIDGSTLTLWIDSLQASFAAVQVLNGDVEEAICAHALYYAIWRRFGALPERFNWQLISPDLSFYPLRPELAESTYHLYQATRNPFYLHVGQEIMQSLNTYAKAECGYATIHNVQDKSLEDRMESFFLSETCKYLYLLFDVDNPLNKHASDYIFTTEGHIFPVARRYGIREWEEYQRTFTDVTSSTPCSKKPANKSDNESSPSAKLLKIDTSIVDARNNNVSSSCERVPSERQYLLPLRHRYLAQVSQALGLDDKLQAI